MGLMYLNDRGLPSLRHPWSAALHAAARWIKPVAQVSHFFFVPRCWTRPEPKLPSLMFSYRHAFHAANHADVLKHTVLIATLRHLLEKDAALTVVDTHAGAGLYLLRGDFAKTSGEAEAGLLRLTASLAASGEVLVPALQDYVDLVNGFNPSGQLKIYPGSPFIIQHLLREHDKLKLFELHPTDAKALSANVAQLQVGRQVSVLREDGFEGVKKFLPPPSRRALVLCDPSYEIKSDYSRLTQMVGDALGRFATGTYAVWYPIISRREAHELPRKLITLSIKAKRPWLHATLRVKSGTAAHAARARSELPRQPAGLTASGMLMINPPYTLQPALAVALPQMARLLGQDRAAAWTLDQG